MTDDALRALDRRVRETGTAADRLRYANALLRLGRRDDALAVLQPGAQDPLVRSEIGRFAAWTHEDGDAGRTRALDVAPLGAEPRMRWRIRRPTFGPARALLASPLGLAWVDRHGTAILDAETGDARREHDAKAAVLAGDVVILEGPTSFEGRDLWTGEHLHRTETAGFFSRRGHDGRTFVGVRTAEALAFELDGFRVAPSAARRLEIPGGFMDFAEADVVLAPGLLLVGKSAEVVALDTTTGAVRWRVPGQLPRSDHAGTVLSTGRRGGLAAFGLDGGRLWQSGDRLAPLALARDFVVAAETASGGGVVSLDRATGAILARLDNGPAGVVAIARSVVYLAGEEALQGVTAQGDVLFMKPIVDLLGGPGQVQHLAPAGGRLYGAGSDGTLFCLERPP